METLQIQLPQNVADALEQNHRQLRNQLTEALMNQCRVLSKGAGWTTVYGPAPVDQPFRLDRGFGNTSLRALYINHPPAGTDDTFNLTVDLLGEPDKCGAYSLDSGRDNPQFSTHALITLLRALEEGELSLFEKACTLM